MRAVVNTPAANSEIGRMEEIFQLQRRAFAEQLPVSAGTRIDRLDRVVELLVRHQDELCAAMNEDFGNRPALLSKFTDLGPAVNALKHARRHLERWMKPDRRSVRFPLNLLGARAWIEYQPKGVVGIISPWNFPVNLTFAPLAAALAAGNRVLIKPSEFTPATSAAIGELSARFFDINEVAVVTGGADAGVAFSRLPFDHLFFTGSTSVGRHIMRAAAQNLTPVTLELGGKSPAIVGHQADLKEAARRIVLGKLMNAGQVCLAPDYVLVPKSAIEKLVPLLADAARELYPEPHSHPDYTQIINEQHTARLINYVEEARAAGVEIVATGERRGDSKCLPLTLMIDPPEHLAVMQEEIFGPVLPVIAYQEIDQAIDYINARPRPLGLYFFGGPAGERRAILDRTIAGGVTLDDVIFHVSVEDLPFGGVGTSGMGAYHGFEGFKTFSHAKSIYRQSRFNVSGLVGMIPPYGKRLKRTVDWDLKR